MRDVDIDACQEHVRRGGGLILIGECGAQDEYGRRRSPTLRQSLSPPAAASAATSRPAATITDARWEAGAGRVVTLRQPGPPANFWLTRKPKRGLALAESVNDDSLAEAVEWAGRRPRILKMEAPQTMAVELTASELSDQYVLHRVNFAERETVEEGLVQLRVAAGRKVAEVQRYVPGDQPPTSMSFTQTDTLVSFQSPIPALYDAILIRTEAADEQPTSRSARD